MMIKVYLLIQMVIIIIAEILAVNMSKCGVILPTLIHHGSCVTQLVGLRKRKIIHVILKMRISKTTKILVIEDVNLKLCLACLVFLGIHKNQLKMETKVQTLEQMEVIITVEIQMDKKNQFGATLVILKTQRKSCVNPLAKEIMMSLICVALEMKL